MNSRRVLTAAAIFENPCRTAMASVNDPVTGATGGISPGRSILARTFNSQIARLNLTLTRWFRLFLSSTSAFQHARTLTGANDALAAAPFAGHIYTAMRDGTFGAKDRTDLVAGYPFSNFEAQAVFATFGWRLP
jgi:hypothetical protein